MWKEGRKEAREGVPIRVIGGVGWVCVLGDRLKSEAQCGVVSRTAGNPSCDLRGKQMQTRASGQAFTGKGFETR